MKLNRNLMNFLNFIKPALNINELLWAETKFIWDLDHNLSTAEVPNSFESFI